MRTSPALGLPTSPTSLGNAGKHQKTGAGKVTDTGMAGTRHRNKLGCFNVTYPWPTPVGCCSPTGTFLFSLLMTLIWTIPALPFLSFNICLFSSLLQLRKSSKILSAPCWSPRRAETLWVMDTGNHAGLWEHNAEMVQGLFTDLAWIQLDLFWTHVRWVFLDGHNKWAWNDPYYFPHTVPKVMILLELSREYDTGTDVQSAHVQPDFLREGLSFVLNGSCWTIFRPSLTLESAMLYSCGARASEPCQTLAISASVAQIISKPDNSTTDALELLVLAANTSVIASAISLSTLGWFSLDPTKLKTSNWRSTP